MLASCKGYGDVAAVLIKAGADVNDKNSTVSNCTLSSYNIDCFYQHPNASFFKIKEWLDSADNSSR